jgi:hypothetical protein
VPRDEGSDPRPADLLHPCSKEQQSTANREEAHMPESHPHPLDPAEDQIVNEDKPDAKPSPDEPWAKSSSGDKEHVTEDDDSE